MDLTSMMQLNSTEVDSQLVEQTVATGRKLVEYMPMTGREKTALLRERIASREFVLCDVPISKLAVVEKRDIMAATERSGAPIVVDINKNRIGATSQGFVPTVIVIEGTTRLRTQRTAGAKSVLAWIGAEALRFLQEAIPVAKLQDRPLPVSMNDSPMASVGTMLANAGGGMGSTGTAGLGSTSLNYGSSGNMDKLGLRARKSMKVPPNPVGKLNANMMVRESSPSAEAGPGGMRVAPSASPGSGVGPRVVMPHTGGHSPSMRPLSAEAVRIKKIVTKYKKAMAAGKVCPPTDDMMAEAPPGMEKTVKGLKKHFPKGSGSPFAIAWWQHNKAKGIKGCGDSMRADMRGPTPGFANGER